MPGGTCRSSSRKVQRLDLVDDLQKHPIGGHALAHLPRHGQLTAFFHHRLGVVALLHPLLQFHSAVERRGGDAHAISAISGLAHPRS